MLQSFPGSPASKPTVLFWSLQGLGLHPTPIEDFEGTYVQEG